MNQRKEKARFRQVIDHAVPGDLIVLRSIDHPRKRFTVREASTEQTVVPVSFYSVFDCEKGTWRVWSAYIATMAKFLTKADGSTRWNSMTARGSGSLSSCGSSFRGQMTIQTEINIDAWMHT